MFDSTDPEDVLITAGATMSLFIMVYRGFITLEDISKCFGQTIESLENLYNAFIKANDLDNIEDDLILSTQVN